MRTGGKKEFTVDKLTDAEYFKVSVKAITKLTIESKVEFKGESSASWVDGWTKPNPPSKPQLIERGFHNASLSWHPPTKIAKSAKIIEYNVQYQAVDKQRRAVTKVMDISTKNTNIELTDLIQGQTYVVGVKVRVP